MVAMMVRGNRDIKVGVEEGNRCECAKNRRYTGKRCNSPGEGAKTRGISKNEQHEMVR
jgi:hypothetical protein